MKQKLVAILVAFVLTISLTACGAGEETTLTGMVVSVDGTVISLMEMDTANMGGMDFSGSERPDMPEGMTMPENGEMPDFEGMGGMRPDFDSIGEGMETKDVDIAGAHISVEIEDGKASGSMDDIKTGSFVTITMNGKGEVTNVLVSARTSFRGSDRRSAK